MRTRTYAAALKRDVLTKQEEIDLCTQYAAARAEHGDEHPKTLALRNRLVMANLRLVAKMAQRYTIKKSLSFDDLMSEGVKGLIVAAERFEVERGWRFITYAQNWVKHALKRALENLGEDVRVPVHQQAKLFRGDLERDGKMLDGRALSLDAPLGEDGGSLYDLLSGDADPVLDELGAQRSATELRRAILEVLTPREREVIESRYLRANEETLQEVGERIPGWAQGWAGRPAADCISRERVRQIEAEALQKLRHALSARHRKDALL